jgi:hypothetical protein
MSNYSQDNYAINYYRIPRSKSESIDHFAPSIQSLKAAQDIVRQYEKRQRATAKLNRQNRRAATAMPPARAAIRDNVIPFHAPVWARPSSRLIYSRHISQPYSLSPAPRARRASLQSHARRLSRHIINSAPSPVDALNRVICDSDQSDMLQNVGLIAIQALAIVLGLGGLLVLLTLL